MGKGAGPGCVEEDERTQDRGDFFGADWKVGSKAVVVQGAEAGDVAGLGTDCFGDEVVLQAECSEKGARRLLFGHVEAVASVAEELADEVAGLLDFRDGVAEVVEIIQVVGHGEAGFDGALADLVHADVGDEG